MIEKIIKIIERIEVPICVFMQFVGFFLTIYGTVILDNQNLKVVEKIPHFILTLMFLIVTVISGLILVLGAFFGFAFLKRFLRNIKAKIGDRN